MSRGSVADKILCKETRGIHDTTLQETHFLLHEHPGCPKVLFQPRSTVEEASQEMQSLLCPELLFQPIFVDKEASQEMHFPIHPEEQFQPRSVNHEASGIHDATFQSIMMRDVVVPPCSRMTRTKHRRNLQRYDLAREPSVIRRSRCQGGSWQDCVKGPMMLGPPRQGGRLALQC